MTAKINHDRYVCFDDNGNIDRISRTPDPNLENLPKCSLAFIAIGK